MSKFLHSLPLHVKSAFRSIKRNIASTISSSFAVTVTLLLVAIFIMSAFSMSRFTRNIEAQIRINVRIDATLQKQDDIDALKVQLEKTTHVNKVTYSSKDEQFDILINSDQGGKRYEQMRDENPLLAVFYMDVSNGKYLDQVVSDVQRIEGVYDASFGGASAKSMVQAFDMIRIGGGIFIGVLSLLAVFLISNTIKLNIQSRREEIAIMRNVGASNGFIKTPFLLEGMLIGWLGSIIPVLVTIFGYGFLYTFMQGQFYTSIFKMYPPMPFVYLISLFIMAVGIIVGFIGSILSVNKYLKWKR